MPITTVYTLTATIVAPDPETFKIAESLMRNGSIRFAHTVAGSRSMPMPEGADVAERRMEIHVTTDGVDGEVELERFANRLIQAFELIGCRLEV